MANASRNLPPEDLYEIRIAWSDEDNAFVARIPDMPYTGAHGDTREEALAEAEKAIRLDLEVAGQFDKPIPVPRTRVSSPT